MTSLPDLLQVLHLARRNYTSIQARVRVNDPPDDPRIHVIRLDRPDRVQREWPPHWKQCAFDPNVIIPELWLEVVGETTVAGRSGIRVRGTTRRTTHDYFVLPGGADEWDIVVDAERGILLRLARLVNGEEVVVFEILEIEFDRPA